MISPVRAVFDAEPPPRYPQVRNRTINLLFEEYGNRISLRAFGTAFPDDGGGGFQGWLTARPSEIRAAVQSLRDTWQHQVIERYEATPGLEYPYAQQWNLSGSTTHPTRWSDVGQRLAREGSNTFKMLFEIGDEGLREIGQQLGEALNRDAQIITIHSEHLHVPWSMLYTPQAGSPSLEAPDAQWVTSGFWGYSHWVEQCLGRANGHDSRIHPAEGRLRTGMNVDPRLDTEFARLPPYKNYPCVAPMIEFFQRHSDVEIRETRPKMAASLGPGCQTEQIMYFGCHMKVSGTTQDADSALTPAQLVLSDDDPIRTADVVVWLGGRKFKPGPIVFANACQGGQLATQFYGSIGATLLDSGINCLIGPQIDLPPVFALEYATRFFEAFFERGVRVGDVTRDLARHFADKCENPLGIAISLFRGIDTHIAPHESAPEPAWTTSR
jgi:hypothetical protein